MKYVVVAGSISGTTVKVAPRAARSPTSPAMMRSMKVEWL
jgi:hypothetical protein